MKEKTWRVCLSRDNIVKGVDVIAKNERFALLKARLKLGISGDDNYAVEFIVEKEEIKIH